MNNIYLLIDPVMATTLVETAPTIKHSPSVEPVICFFILFEMLTLKMSEVEE